MACRVAVCFAILALAHAQQPEWWANLRKKAKDSIVGNSDRAAARSILHGGKFSAVSCGGPDHALRMDGASFDRDSLKVKVKGHLSRTLTGGNVTMALELGKAPRSLTLGQKMKRRIAWVMAGKHHDEETVCEHFKRTIGATCPLQKGATELHFGFKNLPSTVLAGTYNMQLKVIDSESKPVACVQGSLDIPLGPKGEIFRRLAEVTASGAPGGSLTIFTLVAAVAAAIW